MFIINDQEEYYDKRAEAIDLLVTIKELADEAIKEYEDKMTSGEASVTTEKIEQILKELVSAEKSMIEYEDFNS